MAREESRRRTLAAGAVMLAGVVATVLVVQWLRDTAPVASTEGLEVPGAAAAPAELLTCEDLADGPVPAGADRARSTEVLRCPDLFDGRIVTYVGEVVGDVLDRRDGAWLLVNDDDYALLTGPLGSTGVPSGTNSGLAVWLPSDLRDVVTTPGRHGVRGDVVAVVGEVRRADPQDGGGLTVRAAEATLLAPAVTVEPPVHWRQAGVAGLLAAVALVVAVRDRRARRS